MKFVDLYHQLLDASLHGDPQQKKKEILAEGGDPYQLDCLLNPQNHPLIWRMGNCCLLYTSRCV